ncbi:MAG: FG-GAP repeat protein [Proteobacteria bacterium]|nr:FG-GAP repeat protein [Pseudomonadota bacterium]
MKNIAACRSAFALICAVLAGAIVLSFGCSTGGTLAWSEAAEEPTEEPGGVVQLTSGSFGAQGLEVDPHAWLRFDFSEAIYRGSAAANIALLSGDGSALPSASKDAGGAGQFLMQFANDDRTVLLKAKGLPYCYPIMVRFSAELAAVSGSTLGQEYSFEYLTMHDPHDIVGDDCRGDMVAGNPFHGSDADPVEIIPGLLSLGPGIAHVLPSASLAGEGQAILDLGADLGFEKYEGGIGMGDLVAIGLGMPLGDMDGDGIAEAGFYALGVSLDGLALGTLLRCSSNGEELPTAMPGLAFPVGDYNGDGLADVVTNVLDTGSGVQTFSLHLGGAGCVGEPAATWQLGESTLALMPVGIENFNGDLNAANGRPFEDFAIGAIDIGTGVGSVHLFLGSADPSAKAAPDAVIAGSSAGDLFGLLGLSVAGGGDVDGDGYDDMVVGAPAGLASAILNSGIMDAMMGMMFLSEAVPINQNPILSVVSKLVQSDGRQPSAYDGKAYLFHGSASPQIGSASDAAVVFTGEMQALEGLGYMIGDLLQMVGDMMAEMMDAEIEIPDLPGLPDMFGTAVFIGEIDGDGYADVIVGAPLAVHMNEEASNVFALGMEAIMAIMEFVMGGGGEEELLALVEYLYDTATYVVDGIGSAYVFRGEAGLPAEVFYDQADSAFNAEGQYLLGSFILPACDVDGKGLDDFIMTDLAFVLDIDPMEMTFGTLDVRSGLFLGEENVGGFEKDIDDAKAVAVASLPDELIAAVLMILMEIMGFLP